MNEQFKRLKADAVLINEALEKSLPQLHGSTDLVKSMRYSLMADGKRIRPHLTLEFCRLFGGCDEDAMPYACAIEMVHTYSLIHDDLPCMDNDDLRRGRPTNHKVYGEAIAMLAGDALLTHAFGYIAGNKKLDGNTNAKAVSVLAAAAGFKGMIGGQEEDIQNEDQPVSTVDLDRINSKKTGDLLEAACLLGCVAAHASEEEMKSASIYAHLIGNAFQIVDDVLDISKTSKDLGKSVLSDVKNQKTTYASLLGKEGAKMKAKALTEAAVEEIEQYDGAEYLAILARELLDRNK